MLAAAANEKDFSMISFMLDEDWSKWWTPQKKEGQDLRGPDGFLTSSAVPSHLVCTLREVRRIITSYVEQLFVRTPRQEHDSLQY